MGLIASGCNVSFDIFAESSLPANHEPRAGCAWPARDAFLRFLLVMLSIHGNSVHRRYSAELVSRSLIEKDPQGPRYRVRPAFGRLESRKTRSTREGADPADLGHTGGGN